MCNAWMHSIPEYKSKSEVESCQMNGYCWKAEFLLSIIKWVMHYSSMFSLIVWKKKCALPKLFAWQCLFFMSSRLIKLGWRAYQMLRYGSRTENDCVLKWTKKSLFWYCLLCLLEMDEKEMSSEFVMLETCNNLYVTNTQVMLKPLAGY